MPSLPTGDAARDIVSGGIDAVLITTSSIRPPVVAGKARILAVTSVEPVPSLPDVPTFAEAGLPGYDLNDWNGLFAASGTPRAAIERIAAAAAHSAKAPAVRARMDPAGAIMIGNSPEAFASWLAAPRQTVSGVIREARHRPGVTRLSSEVSVAANWLAATRAGASPARRRRDASARSTQPGALYAPRG